jgi:hypothetical protein
LLRGSGQDIAKLQAFRARLSAARPPRLPIVHPCANDPSGTVMGRD